MVVLEKAPATAQRVNKIVLASGLIDQLQQAIAAAQSSLAALQSTVTALQGELGDIEDLIGDIPEGETIGEILTDHGTRITMLEGAGGDQSS
ncbi:MAG TPA: hypothetical protein PLW12_09275 [Methanothrix sp.]|nr:hypothetical protein [Methanothrix sp.]